MFLVLCIVTGVQGVPLRYLLNMGYYGSWKMPYRHKTSYCNFWSIKRTWIWAAPIKFKQKNKCVHTVGQKSIWTALHRLSIEFHPNAFFTLLYKLYFTINCKLETWKGQDCLLLPTCLPVRGRTMNNAKSLIYNMNRPLYPHTLHSESSHWVSVSSSLPRTQQRGGERQGEVLTSSLGVGTHAAGICVVTWNKHARDI